MITRLRAALRTRFDALFYRQSNDLERAGSLCTWVIAPKFIPYGGTVISGGVGQDISFEKELCSRFGCTVYLYDPSPTGGRTMANPENRLPGIRFQSLGLAGEKARLSFSAPRDPAEGSFSIATRPENATVCFDCTTVSEIVERERLNACSLLKLDIEGFEYGVLRDLLELNICIPQICVEFHHFLPNISIWRTIRAISALQRAGYRIAFKRQCEYLFVHRSIDLV